MNQMLFISSWAPQKSGVRKWANDWNVNERGGEKARAVTNASAIFQWFARPVELLSLKSCTSCQIKTHTSHTPRKRGGREIKRKGIKQHIHIYSAEEPRNQQIIPGLITISCCVQFQFWPRIATIFRHCVWVCVRWPVLLHFFDCLFFRFSPSRESVCVSLCDWAYLRVWVNVYILMVESVER